MSSWNDLSMKERADVMKLFIEKGIYNLDTIREEYNRFAKGGCIHIKDSKKGTFTAAASRHGMGVQEFASKVLANKDDYSPAMVKKANFARNASHWKHGLGGNLFEEASDGVQKSPHVDLAVNNPWLYQKLHPQQKKHEKYEPTTFAGRVTQVTGANEKGQKYADYSSSVIQQVPVVGVIPSALDLGYDANKLYNNPSVTAVKDVALDVVSLFPALRKTMKGWWLKGNSGQFVTETGQIISNPRMASSLEVALQPFRTAINTGVYVGRTADFVDDSKAFLKDMYNDSPIGKHFPIKAYGGSLRAAMDANDGIYAHGGLMGNYYDGWGDAWNFLKRGWNKVKDTVQASAVYDNPAVMTAAGQKVNKQGRVEYNHAQDKDVRQLRSNISTIGEVGLAAPTLVSDLEATLHVLRHPIQTARAIKRAATEGVNYVRSRQASKVLPHETPAATYKSELDWSPESWLGQRANGVYDAEDVAALQSHVPEYLEIEKAAKANNTWLKMPDGSIWTGDPRSWVQLQSRTGQKLSQERLFTGMDMDKARNPEYTGEVWTDKERKVSSFWAGEENTYPGKVLEIAPAKGPRYIVDGKGHVWSDIPREQNGVTLPITKGWQGTTSDGIMEYAISKGYPTSQINNVIEGSGDLVTDVMIHPHTPRKSLLGNNGNFDFSNFNIYKGLIPIGIGTGALNTKK